MLGEKVKEARSSRSDGSRAPASCMAMRRTLMEVGSTLRSVPVDARRRGPDMPARILAAGDASPPSATPDAQNVHHRHRVFDALISRSAAMAPAWPLCWTKAIIESSLARPSGFTRNFAASSPAVACVPVSDDDTPGSLHQVGNQGFLRAPSTCLA